MPQTTHKLPEYKFSRHVAFPAKRSVHFPTRYNKGMAIGSHTIPRFYLEQFANPSKRKGKPGEVWTYEKGKPTHPRSTRSQGYQNGYFAYFKEDGTADESFETRLAELEDRYNDALVCAKSQFYDLNSLAHRNHLGFYIGMLFARSTVRRKFSESNWAKLQTPFAQLESDENYLHDAAAHYSEVLGEDVTIENIANVIRRVAATFTDKKLTGNSFIKDLLFHAEMLKGEIVPRPWQVLKAPTGAEFITSDNPVITFIKLKEDLWHPGHGFRKTGVVIAFPLAPSACLTIGIEGREYEEVDAATVMRMNDLVVRCCDRFVYSRALSKEIEGMVNAVSRTSVPGETAFIGAFPGTEQIQQYLRKRIGIKQAERP